MMVKAIAQMRRTVRGLAVLLLAAASLPSAQAQTAPSPPVKIDDDGTVHVPAMAVPVSSMLSPEAKQYLTDHLKAMQDPVQVQQNNGVPVFMEPYLAEAKAMFAYTLTERRIAGVRVFDYAPKAGIAKRNARRVLINLHGGGFMGCFPACAELESIPVVTLGEFRVVSVDYRQGPEHKFPAASEDVAQVYRELLKTYPAANIGIYGCSAGGMLTGMATAWFQKYGLPRPGAVGILCAGLTTSANGFGGDADYMTAAVGEARPAPQWPPNGDAPWTALPYFAGSDPTDPLVAPGSSDEVLRQFPPTLIITGTRGFELSSAVNTHSRMVALGVDADLHVWEGLFHGFFYKPDMPESRQAYDVILKFFDRNLGQ
ncbi:alpha/beta hydrolase [Blastomonas fulva]|uniref:alpha/beta hydrolase n=1 Tax=Blastomonas fulva TaxID=1550728 RepID=UPI0025A4A34F|nr:alpha/beta hydrolase fold domain-containing protein [Blastomonas fulva]MDM7927706.1 alpha/beta hydrolase fold domain-containing protein [Blastomonas fulva]MDM7965194.1 alpha/beta hydrolase fold domain-containing protein [Blastomonas fulva]